MGDQKKKNNSRTKKRPPSKATPKTLATGSGTTIRLKLPKPKILNPEVPAIGQGDAPSQSVAAGLSDTSMIDLTHPDDSDSVTHSGLHRSHRMGSSGPGSDCDSSRTSGDHVLRDTAELDLEDLEELEPDNSNEDDELQSSDSDSDSGSGKHRSLTHL